MAFSFEICANMIQFIRVSLLMSIGQPCQNRNSVDTLSRCEHRVTAENVTGRLSWKYFENNQTG